MIGLYPADAVRGAEERLLQRLPAGSLMQVAARGLATNILRLVRDVRGSVVGTRVVLLIGSGNNGGDALFAGAYLQRRGMSVVAVTVTDSHHEAGSREFTRAGGAFVRRNAAVASMEEADVIVDGVVGIGARGPLREPAASLVRAANASDALRIAVDVPSGIDVDTGRVHEIAFEADATVTFGCYKPGLYLHPGRVCAGAVHLVDIGLEPQLPEPTFRMVDQLDVAELLTPPHVDDHKYHRGVVQVAAGSTTYPGAAVLTVGAARYAGVGMVRFLDRGDGLARHVIESFPDVVADPRDPRTDPRVRAWGCGPGFTEADAQTVRMVLTEPTPVVLDAGALQCLASDPSLRDDLRQRGDRGLVTVVTPHEGEFRALFGPSSSARDAAATWGVIVVHKGPATTISAPDGTTYVDPMGTADLAYAGSGDVLTGVMAGLLAARPDDDAQLVAAAAVWLHGLAGRCAATGERPITATDVSAALPKAISATRTGDLAGCGP